MIGKIIELFKKDYETLNHVVVSKKALVNNYKYLLSLEKAIKIAPVIKSNAYGHGIIETAKILDTVKAPFFCVDSLFEAYKLLKLKIKTPVLILGYTNPQNFKIKKLPFKFTVYDLESAKTLNEYQKGSSIHIFVDTALHREGVPIDNLIQFLKKLKQFKNLKIEGLMSHFASTESDKDPLFKKQMMNFKKAIDVCKKEGISPEWIHIGASGGLINPSTRKEIAKISNLARAGLISYGIGPDPKLKPALKLTSKISQIKKIKKGERIGYDGTHQTKKDTVIATIPIGYQDGVDRRLSSVGFVSINNIFCPILGRVSMNITTIDISKVKNPFTGQEVVIYSDKPNDKNSISYSAKLCKTIAYELLIHINMTVKRVII